MLQARQANQRDAVTGALICRRDIYLQLLEGPEAAVRSAYDRIRRDDRHLEVRLHIDEPVPTRLFADWAMLHDPAQSLIWPPEALTDARRAALTPTEIRRVFAELAATTGPAPHI